jgi:hypothetical protein
MMVKALSSTNATMTATLVWMLSAVLLSQSVFRWKLASASPTSAARIRASFATLQASTIGNKPIWNWNEHAFQPERAPVDPSLNDFDIQRVMIIHRHGDRSQIKSNLGFVLPDSNRLREFWTSRMPSSGAEEILASVANVEMHLVPDGVPEITAVKSAHTRVYAGQDYHKYPFGMLTQRGVDQLMNIGRMVYQRYGNLLKVGGSFNASAVYARSSNYCRTQLSVRSLLLGLMEHPLRDNNLDGQVTIVTRPRERETMFPDEKCAAIIQHTARVCKIGTLPSKVPNYMTFTRKMEQLLRTKSSFGPEVMFENHKLACDITSEGGECIPSLNDTGATVKDMMTWPDIKEVVTCHWVHRSGFLPASIDESFVTKCSEIASQAWFEKYSVRIISYFLMLL